MSANLYSRQQRWREHVQMKNARAHREREAQEDADLTFEPVRYSAEHPGQHGPAPVQLDESVQRHIERQRRARGQKGGPETRSQSSGGSVSPRSGNRAAALPAPEELAEAAAASGGPEDGGEGKGEGSGSPSRWAEMTNGDLDEEEEETFFAQLQRERREWRKEREQLLRVIELQQVELNKRSAAVSEKATGIAQSFSDTISTFEERLVHLESSVASELRMLRQRMAGSTAQAAGAALGGGTPNGRS